MKPPAPLTPGRSPRASISGVPETLTWDSVPVYGELVSDVVPRAVKKAKQATGCGVGFVEAESLLRTALLNLVGLRARALAMRPGRYTVLHQAKVAIMRMEDLCDSYADGLPPLCLAEPFSLRLADALARLRAAGVALAAVADAPAGAGVPPADPAHCVPMLTPADYTVGLGGTIHSLPKLLASDAAHPAFSLAAEGRWGEVAALLQDHREYATAAAGGPFRLLHLAALWQSPLAVALLLDCGADPEATTGEHPVVPEGSTALHLASLVGDAATVRLLLAWGANRNALTVEGRTPAQVATPHCRAIVGASEEVRKLTHEVVNEAHRGNFPRVFDLVLQGPLPLDVKFRASSTVFLLHQAAHAAGAEGYLLLVDAGASPLLRSRDKGLPSDVAALNPSPGVRLTALAVEEAALRHAPCPTSYSPGACPPPTPLTPTAAASSNSLAVPGSPSNKRPSLGVSSNRTRSSFVEASVNAVHRVVDKVHGRPST